MSLTLTYRPELIGKEGEEFRLGIEGYYVACETTEIAKFLHELLIKEYERQQNAKVQASDI